MPTTITISPEHLHTLRDHLLTGKVEQVGFGFSVWTPNGEGGALRVESVELIPIEGFAFQSSYHIELSDETKVRIIKLALDRRASLVEFHSHRTRWPARFSSSDFHVFDEFVPHVRWRLGGRPYAAVVFHESSFDGLAWVENHRVQLDYITPDGQAPLTATGRSLQAAEEDDER
jgi:hypothetical protein